MLSKLMHADPAGLHEQLLRHDRLQHELSQDRREADVQPGTEAEPERAPGVPPELGALRGDPAGGGRGVVQPDLPGPRTAESFVNSHSVGVTSILSQSFVVDGTFGYTKHNVHVFPPEHDCAGDILGIPNACQPPNSLDTAIPTFTGAG